MRRALYFLPDVVTKSGGLLYVAFITKLIATLAITETGRLLAASTFGNAWKVM